MADTVPHFLLFSESAPVRPGRFVAFAGAPFSEAAGRWRFVLESIEGDTKLEASDYEPQVSGERLELLAVVRGLEALEQPSRVTLLTPSRYVSRGIRFGLDEWRENHWQWECFGKMLPVKNFDLWRRIDEALKIHAVNCRSWAHDAAEPDDRGAGKQSDLKALHLTLELLPDAGKIDDSTATISLSHGSHDRENMQGEEAQDASPPDAMDIPAPTLKHGRRPILRALQQSWSHYRSRLALLGMLRLGGARMSG